MRIYRRWSGNPDGHREDPELCVAAVSDGGRSVLSHQCGRRRGFGPKGELCKQHARCLERGSVWIPPDRPEET